MSHVVLLRHEYEKKKNDSFYTSFKKRVEKIQAIPQDIVIKEPFLTTKSVTVDNVATLNKITAGAWSPLSIMFFFIPNNYLGYLQLIIRVVHNHIRAQLGAIYR